MAHFSIIFNVLGITDNIAISTLISLILILVNIAGSFDVQGDIVSFWVTSLASGEAFTVA